MPDVLIVGAGPTGLTAALLLAQRGLSVRIVEKETGLSRRSKAFGVNPRTLTLLESTGVTEQLLERGHRLRAVNLYRNGRRFYRLDLSRLEHRYPFMLIHSQAKTEALLAERLAGRGVQVEFGVELTKLSIENDGATAVLRHGDGGEEEAKAGVVLGADGPRSAVRREIESGFPGSTFDEPWMLYDLQLDVPLEPNEAHLFLHEASGMALIRLEGDLWRVAGNAPDLMKRLPAGTKPGPVDWESEFTISHRLAERFQRGNVCLAGDAAHLHSPLGARGMNLGVEDAYVFATLAAEGRLQDYERLRRPVDQRVVDAVRRISELPRGRSVWSRAARQITPLLGSVLPAGAGQMRKWLLGLDHDVNIA